MFSYYETLFDNITSYSGSGLLFTLLLISILFLFFAIKDKVKRMFLVLFPVIILAIAFCPAWAIYIAKRDDAVILYRLFWIIPSVVIISYAFVTAIMMIPQKFRAVSLALVVLISVISGEYIYANKQFTRAENIYHIPDTVIKICDEIEVPGREVRACFPDEFIQYVRQYTALVLQPYGRETLLAGAYGTNNAVEYEVNKSVIDAQKLTEVLREADTPYLIVAEDRVFNDSLWNYGFCYVTTIDGYEIYLDDNAYLGLDAVDYR